MASGASYINLSGNKHLFKEINRFTSRPCSCFFFVLSGMRLNIPALGHGRRWRRLLFPCVQENTLVPCRLRSLPHAGAYQKLAGAGVDPPGRRIHRTGCFGGSGCFRRKQGALLSAIILSSAVLAKTVGPASAKASPVPVPIR